MEEGEWEVGKGEGVAFRAGRDHVHAVTAVVGEGGAKIVGAVPVGVPRKTVVGAVKRQTKLAGDEWGGLRSRKVGGEGRTRQRGRDRDAKVS